MKKMTQTFSISASLSISIVKTCIVTLLALAIHVDAHTTRPPLSSDMPRPFPDPSGLMQYYIGGPSASDDNSGTLDSPLYSLTQAVFLAGANVSDTRPLGLQINVLPGSTAFRSRVVPGILRIFKGPVVVKGAGRDASKLLCDDITAFNTSIVVQATSLFVHDLTVENCVGSLFQQVLSLEKVEFSIVQLQNVSFIDCSGELVVSITTGVFIDGIRVIGHHMPKDGVIRESVSSAQPYPGSLFGNTITGGGRFEMRNSYIGERMTRVYALQTNWPTLLVNVTFANITQIPPMPDQADASYGGIVSLACKQGDSQGLAFVRFSDNLIVNAPGSAITEVAKMGKGLCYLSINETQWVNNEASMAGLHLGRYYQGVGHIFPDFKQIPILNHLLFRGNKGMHSNTYPASLPELLVGGIALPGGSIVCNTCLFHDNYAQNGVQARRQARSGRHFVVGFIHEYTTTLSSIKCVGCTVRSSRTNRDQMTSVPGFSFGLESSFVFQSSEFHLWPEDYLILVNEGAHVGIDSSRIHYLKSDPSDHNTGDVSNYRRNFMSVTQRGTALITRTNFTMESPRIDPLFILETDLGAGQFSMILCQIEYSGGPVFHIDRSTSVLLQRTTIIGIPLPAPCTTKSRYCTPGAVYGGGPLFISQAGTGEQSAVSVEECVFTGFLQGDLYSSEGYAAAPMKFDLRGTNFLNVSSKGLDLYRQQHTQPCRVDAYFCFSENQVVTFRDCAFVEVDKPIFATGSNVKITGAGLSVHENQATPALMVYRGGEVDLSRVLTCPFYDATPDITCTETGSVAHNVTHNVDTLKLDGSFTNTTSPGCLPTINPVFDEETITIPTPLDSKSLTTVHFTVCPGRPRKMEYMMPEYFRSVEFIAGCRTLATSSGSSGLDPHSDACRHSKVNLTAVLILPSEYEGKHSNEYDYQQPVTNVTYKGTARLTFDFRDDAFAHGLYLVWLTSTVPAAYDLQAKGVARTMYVPNCKLSYTGLVLGYALSGKSFVVKMVVYDEFKVQLDAREFSSQDSVLFAFSKIDSNLDQVHLRNATAVSIQSLDFEVYPGDTGLFQLRFGNRYELPVDATARDLFLQGEVRVIWVGWLYTMGFIALAVIIIVIALGIRRVWKKKHAHLQQNVEMKTRLLEEYFKDGPSQVHLQHLRAWAKFNHPSALFIDQDNIVHALCECPGAWHRVTWRGADGIGTISERDVRKLTPLLSRLHEIFSLTNDTFIEKQRITWTPSFVGQSDVLSSVTSKTSASDSSTRHSSPVYQTLDNFFHNHPGAPPRLRQVLFESRLPLWVCDAHRREFRLPLVRPFDLQPALLEAMQPYEGDPHVKCIEIPCLQEFPNESPFPPLIELVKSELNRLADPEYDYIVTRMKVFSNSTLEGAFRERYHLLSLEGRSRLRRPWPDYRQDHRQIVMNELKAHLRRLEHDPDTDDLVNLDLVWHGAIGGEAAGANICKLGFMNLATLNNGWYGRGSYFTHFPDYALFYGGTGSNVPTVNMTPFGEHVLVLSYALLGQAYPVVERMDRPTDPEHAFHGGYPGYDSHFALTGHRGQPCSEFDPPTYQGDEVVCWQENQVLPRFLVYIQKKKKELYNSTDMSSGDYTV